MNAPSHGFAFRRRIFQTVAALMLLPFVAATDLAKGGDGPSDKPADATPPPESPALLPKVGDTFPDLSKFGLGGVLPELKGHVVLIDFWAAWCIPCKKSFPVMKELHEKLSGRGLIILGISLDEEKSAMDGFLKENPVPFPTVHDPLAKTAEALGIGKLPTSFLLSGEGKILAVHEGFSGEDRRKACFDQIEAALRAAGK